MRTSALPPVNHWPSNRRRRQGQLRTAWIGLTLAALFWLVLFGLRLVNFWSGMSVAALVLTVYALAAGGSPWHVEEWNRLNVLIGLVGAGVLYAIFAGANWLSQYLLPFAGGQVGAIYTIRSQANPWVIGLVLLFVTSPAEEIFWRGLLQRRFVQVAGTPAGWLMATLCYGAVHLFSGNLMLVGAALVAGAFWGWLYLWRQSVVPGIVSHAVWTILVFVLFPFGSTAMQTGAGAVGVGVVGTGVLSQLTGALSGVLTLPVASAFVVPGTTPLTDQSRWEYDSNLGKVTVRITEVRQVPAAGTDRTFLRWELSVRGLTYQELLEVRGSQLLTWERSARAFGRLYHDLYSYPVPEYGMPEPLRSGASWQWQGVVYRGVPAPPPTPPAAQSAAPATTTAAGANQPHPATATPPAGATAGEARASGQVVGWEKVAVPAGEFGAWHVHLERTDTFGAQQAIELWVNPSIGVVRAAADLRWGGVIGKVQRLIGLDHFTVQLTSTNVR